MDETAEHLITVNESMLSHALNQGLRLEPELAETFYQLKQKYQQALEGEAELAHEGIRSLTRIQQALSRILAPASPRTLRLLYRESQNPGPLSFLGPVPLIRHLSLISIALLILLVLHCITS